MAFDSPPPLGPIQVMTRLSFFDMCVLQTMAVAQARGLEWSPDNERVEQLLQDQREHPRWLFPIVVTA